MGSFAEVDVEGFSITVPNCANAVGVRSSIGIRIDGAGIDVGILAVARHSSARCNRCKVTEDGEVELRL